MAPVRAQRIGRLVVLPGVALLALAGCSGSGPEATPTVSIPPMTTPAPTPTEADDDAAVLEVFERYNEARVAALNGPDPSPELWTDFASEEIVAEFTSQARDYAENDIAFTGEPTISDVEVTWEDDDTAVVLACADDSGWIGTQAGEPLPPRPFDVYPIALLVERDGDRWVAHNGASVPEDLTC